MAMSEPPRASGAASGRLSGGVGRYSPCGLAIRFAAYVAAAFVAGIGVHLLTGTALGLVHAVCTLPVLIGMTAFLPFLFAKVIMHMSHQDGLFAPLLAGVGVSSGTYGFLFREPPWSSELQPMGGRFVVMGGIAGLIYRASRTALENLCERKSA